MNTQINYTTKIITQNDFKQIQIHQINTQSQYLYAKLILKRKYIFMQVISLAFALPFTNHGLPKNIGDTLENMHWVKNMVNKKNIPIGELVKY